MFQKSTASTKMNNLSDQKPNFEKRHEGIERFFRMNTIQVVSWQQKGVQTISR